VYSVDMSFSLLIIKVPHYTVEMENKLEIIIKKEGRLSYNHPIPFVD
jgi:hypothetical protein